MSSHEGGCHCGAVRFAVEVMDADAGGNPDEAPRTALCHCADCRRCSGAPVVGWTAVAGSTFSVTKGEPAIYQSSPLAQRSFCAQCGTGLFYINETVLPGLVDIQTATFDDPDAFPAMAHIQVADAIGWMNTAHDLPKFDRFPEF